MHRRTHRTDHADEDECTPQDTTRCAHATTQSETDLITAVVPRLTRLDGAETDLITAVVPRLTTTRLPGLVYGAVSSCGALARIRCPYRLMSRAPEPELPNLRPDLRLPRRELFACVVSQHERLAGGAHLKSRQIGRELDGSVCCELQDAEELAAGARIVAIPLEHPGPAQRGHEATRPISISRWQVTRRAAGGRRQAAGGAPKLKVSSLPRDELSQ